MSHPQCQKTMTVRVNQKRLAHSLVRIGTNSSCLVVLGAVIIRAVIEGAVSAPDGSPAPLVHEMPVKTSEGTVLGALVLQEERALLDAKLLQVPGTERRAGGCRRWSGAESRGPQSGRGFANE